MPLDPSIFMQGAALRQRQNEQLLQNLQNEEELGLKRKALEAESGLKGFDLDKLAGQALIKKEMGVELSPQENATLHAWDQINTTKLAQDPTGNYRRINASIFGDTTPAPAGFNSRALGPQGQGSNPAITTAYDQITPTLGDQWAANESASTMPSALPNVDESQDIPAPVGFNAEAFKPPPQEILGNPNAMQKYNETIAGKTAEDQVKKQSERPQAEAKIMDAAAKINNVDNTITQALNKIGPSTAGVGSNLKDIPILGKGTDAYDLEAALNTIKADAAFSELQKMRDNSVTGGALGQVSEIELQLLSSAAASLDQGQKPETLKANLKKYQEIRRGALKRVADAFEKDYGYRPDFEKPAETKRRKYNPATGKIE